MKGVCRWNQLLSSDPLQLPIDHEQLPDIFIHLYAQGKPICFTRVRPYQLEKTSGGNVLYYLDFDDTAKWFVLRKDKVNE